MNEWSSEKRKKEKQNIWNESGEKKKDEERINSGRRWKKKELETIDRRKLIYANTNKSIK